MNQPLQPSGGESRSGGAPLSRGASPLGDTALQATEVLQTPIDSDVHIASGSAGQRRSCAVEVVEGSTPHLSDETHALLRNRLRAASIVLGAGFAVFLVRNYFIVDFRDQTQAILFAFHAVVAAVMGIFGTILCRKCTFSLRTLRVTEVTIFALPAVFFLAMQYYHILQFEREKEYVESPVPTWQLLMFIYAMFIPNTWRRAAVVLAAMALVPWTIFMFEWFSSARFSASVSREDMVGLTLLLSISYGTCVLGVYVINSLRLEAFEARQLGQYRLKKLLGTGGMGEVYLAEHQLLKRPCAIKLIRRGKSHDPQALARFEREVRASAKLSHWNTIEIFDYGHTPDGTFYYVMEYLPGMNLNELVERHGPLPPERVIYLLTQTCDGLGEAHAMGLVHRDIKPGNLFAAQRGGVYDVAKLLDFGLVKPALLAGSTQLTQEGMITGSPLYMSPEQATGDGTPDARSDIYSLGAVAYFLLTGRPPFAGDNPIKVMVAHAQQQPEPPSQLRADIPEDLEQVVLRCLAKDATQRYQNTSELVAALSECETAGRWTREHARRWWQQVGCPSVLKHEELPVGVN